MLTILAFIAAIALPPRPEYYVTDRAGVLADSKALNEKLAQFERQTSDQIVVYVDQRLPPDTTIEQMGSEAIKQWGVGQKGKDNGAILFVFIADRKMRIEVGYGLESALTDAKSRDIIETVIKPKFKAGDYNGGVEDGVAAMIATIRGEPYKGTGLTVAEARGQSPSKAMEVATAILLGLMMIVVFLFPLVGVGVIAWAIQRAFKNKTPEEIAATFSRFGVSGGFSSSGGSSFSSSSSSSSGFSGGGGSGGGGGASGSW